MENNYVYRGLPCARLDGTQRNWHVFGVERSPDGYSAGVLEWCESKEDAEDQLNYMSKFDCFEHLKVGYWRDE